MMAEAIGLGKLRLTAYFCFSWQVSVVVYVVYSSKLSITVSPWKVSMTENLLALR